MTLPQSRRREFTLHGTTVRLRKKVHALLEVLLMNQGRWVNADTLLEYVWPDPDQQPLTAWTLIRAYICQLRQIIGLDSIDRRTCSWHHYDGAYMLKRFLYER